MNTFPPRKAMRRALALLLAALASAGCLQASWDGLRDVAPVVLVEESFEVQGAGSAQGFFGMPCEMARFTRDPAEVTLFRPKGPGGPVGFVMLQDMGDSWRAANHTAEAGYTFLGLAAGSGGGPLPWLKGTTRTTMETAMAFRQASREGRVVSWDGGRALFDGEPLEEGAPVTRTFAYDVPTDEGGALRVTETLRVTYLGKLHVTVEEMDCAPRVT